MWKAYLQLPPTVYLLCVGTLINRAGTFLLVFITLYLERTLHLGVEFATRAMGVAGFGSLLAGVVGGHLSDRFGRRAVMLGSLIGGATIMVLFGYLQAAPWIMAALFLFNFLSDMYRPAVMAMIADVVEPERRPQAFALMYVAINLGFAIAPILGGWLIQWSYQWLFRVDAITTLAYAVIILLAIRETLPAKASRRRELATPPPPVDDGSRALRPPVERNGDNRRISKTSGEEIPLFRALGMIARDFTFVRFIIGLLLVSLVFVQSHSTLPLYMGQLGFDETQYGHVIALNGVLIVLLQLPLTAVVSRYSRAWMLVTAALFVGLGFGAVEWSTTQWHFGATVLVWTIGEIMQAPLLSAIVGDLAPVRLRARYMGILSMCFSSAVTIGSPLGGVVLARLGSGYVWYGGVFVAILAAVMFASIGKALSNRHVEAGA
jgi:MFS family permease